MFRTIPLAAAALWLSLAASAQYSPTTPPPSAAPPGHVIPYQPPAGLGSPSYP